MAYKDSGEIANNSNYALGDYSFRIERTSVPGSTNDKIEAICTKEGKNARKSIQVASNTQFTGWYVEADDTEATVYAVIKASPLVVGDLNSIQYAAETMIPIGHNGYYYQFIKPNGNGLFTIIGTNLICGGIDSQSGSFWYASRTNPDGSGTGGSVSPEIKTYNYSGKTVYYSSMTLSNAEVSYGSFPLSNVIPTDANKVAWEMVYGHGASEEYEVMVGRFAIDIEDAGGVGPGSDWVDPGDYDPDWEEGEPTHTLYVTVTGALSGRHNDPIVDPSYSYIPADKDTVKDYGCGGDGGHGGGGGAGASTVVIHKFATNQANSKEVTAIARRHGYGSGGGKGGKGGDGCILVYY